MKVDYLHNHKEFSSLIKILSEEMAIIPQLIEKDYWIMHVLYGLKKQDFEFELKGGTSLSKGYKIINRFSEDIDIHIKPSSEDNVETNTKKTKDSHNESRKNYYDSLSSKIQIDGIQKVIRDEAFDDKDFRSGGIRLIYNSTFETDEGLKDGILLELGFDTVTPNSPQSISSWAYEKAISTTGINIIDNRAIDVLCYHPGYTLVEKLQTITRKFRIEVNKNTELPNLLRQYYDVYSLLGVKEINNFVGSKEYIEHKAIRFKKDDIEIPINENEAFLLSKPELRKRFIERYQKTAALYYKGQPDFDEILSRIHENINRL